MVSNVGGHEIIARALERFPNADIVSVVQACVYLEEFDLGIRLYNRLPEPTSDDTRWLGVCHFQRVEDNDASTAFQRAIDSGQQAARVNLAHLLKMSDQSQRAELELQQVDFAHLTTYDQVFFLRVKSIHEETNGNLRDALRFAEEAWRRLQGLPEFALLAPSILSQLGILHGRIGRAERALWFLERSIQLTSGLAQLKSRLRWATVLVAQCRTSEAQSLVRELEGGSFPDAMKAELHWLHAELLWLLKDHNAAMAQYEFAISAASRHQVVYEEFLCQIALATLVSLKLSNGSKAKKHLKRAQHLISDEPDQLAFRFREVLVLANSGEYVPEHAIRELEGVSDSFGTMGLLQEQGFVRFHILRLKAQGGNRAFVEDLESLRALAATLKNPHFLEREFHLAPDLRRLVDLEVKSFKNEANLHT